MRRTAEPTCSGPRNRGKSDYGFTLVEIMIVVSIIGALATLAIPSFSKARTESQRVACLNNLRQMAAAKEVAALANNWSNTDGPVSIGNPGYRNTISQYIKGGQRPMCPTGAECYFNALDRSPTCQSGIDTHVYDASN
jgi:prepilin-type N-terminal cleavage/methylation domain-containing protein